jgi:hypothetical protein
MECTVLGFIDWLDLLFEKPAECQTNHDGQSDSRARFIEHDALNRAKLPNPQGATRRIQQIAVIN